jgi:hypothetical protein
MLEIIRFQSFDRSMGQVILLFFGEIGHGGTEDKTQGDSKGLELATLSPRRNMAWHVVAWKPV